ncbi:hypothetical protein BS333_16165 [Vibrio azureus]|uniref:DUF6891 domain-containing protein n=1 Tax=Vibrio azureus NBRC 104587 TaxID=1219077 RepID=U3ARF4_9VIBR|nr:hypothetical protein [Vibrio azureus]AUI87923.1 hypothetical protein BS333_16165 [Vibrio azureus]GAD76320.1 hypothetical protein VAZ01S_041_00210 [Vibrio azureus NBRC 104587]
MNEEEKYILDSIKGWVWSGFYSIVDIREMIYDNLEEGCDEEMLLASIEPEIEKKRLAEKEWPEVTDFDRLHGVFYKLHEEGICALHNAGYTMSDGFEDVSEVVHDAPKDHYHSFCFYHGQDVEGAVNGRGLMIAFGALESDDEKSVQTGKRVAECLSKAGFKVDWDGSIKTRIFLPEIKWQKRTV